MELPSRPKNDRYTRPGEYREVESRLRRLTDNADIPCLVAYAFDEKRQMSADVACTGEEFVLIELLDRMMAHRGHGEHPRKVFHRLRRAGLLDDIPGLVFREGDEREPLGRLIDTGIQRMVQ